ncbi:ferredoxin:protochlorophyllide reductase (ATP-dependent) subunit N [Chlorobium phaeovibrioides]|uniref:Light-independent protochlorophyllide reductase subunit N n=1 Tax=Chlorobium phaeovibrioides TaxID=1094 RepID=A0A3S0LPN9_CHLPH|nr:ferredoxin:protochlorophyllide reductase (ATP-dependent) subunit N [Chlorobium phaeovibrioides]MWV53549.1 ferredoxin:protochlorophyllide reductase (ATP-dependent) subunit N [Chlorobium phaeovibrioides]QEQ57519.1 ferredoxin:protochlorophyllide reductase (ATP-dependent) subunit N [Chlorobium phaeovibrioides]RTY37836.1 ferredoxin:protochlorophyllide reductase (ATP-dependent) subunit N [Chlorobium phaeovibrioides]
MLQVPGDGSIIKEDNVTHSFCGLACVGWMYQKIKDSFFLILGTHTCAHFLQNALGMMIFAKPRFGIALLEEGDLSKHEPSLEEIIAEIKADHNPSVIFLLSSCTPEVMKVDFKGLADHLATPEVPVLFVPASGLVYNFTQAEDSVLHALVPFCPQAPAGEKSVVFLGSVNDATADDLRAEAEELGIKVGGFLPESRFEHMPAIGPDTVLAPIQPYLSRVAVKLERERGARTLHSLFPFGPDGTRAFWEDLAKMFGIEVDLSDREKAAWEKIRRQTDLLKGKQVFLTADTMMELPLARFLHSAGAEVMECSSAYINKKFHARELQALEGVRVVEQPNFHRQLEDIKRERPDMVVTSLMTANPFVGQGFIVKWSMEFMLMSIHGWSGVFTLANMFVSPFDRRSALPEFDRDVWLEGVMPSAEKVS